MPRVSKWRKIRRQHSKRRAAERYHIHLTNKDLVNIVGLIRNGKATASCRITCSKSAILVQYMGENLFLLYSKRHKEILTFLPDDGGDARRLEAAKGSAAIRDGAHDKTKGEINGRQTAP